MSVYKPENSPYYHYDFIRKGRRFYGSTGCKSKRDAQEFENRKKREVALPALQRPPITLNEACGLYQEKVELMPSWPTMRYMLSELIRGIGKNNHLSEISQRDLQRYFAGRRSGRSNSTVNREIENERAVWKHAEKSRYDVGEMPDWTALKLKAPRMTPRELSMTKRIVFSRTFGRTFAMPWPSCLSPAGAGTRCLSCAGPIAVSNRSRP